VNLKQLTVTNSALGVSSSGSLTLRRSSVTGSSIVDLNSVQQPMLVATTCGSSKKITNDNTSSSWMVCAND
jgi:hypothetical protein